MAEKAPRYRSYNDVREEGRQQAANDYADRQATAADRAADIQTTRQGAATVAAAPKQALVGKSTAQKMVLISMFLLVVIAIWRSKTPENDVNLYKRLWGVTVLGFFLSLLADFVPTIAGPFAIVTVLGSLTNGGDTAIQNALGGLSSKVPTPAAKAGTNATGTTTIASTTGG